MHTKHTSNTQQLNKQNYGTEAGEVKTKVKKQGRGFFFNSQFSIVNYFPYLCKEKYIELDIPDSTEVS